MAFWLAVLGARTSLFSARPVSLLGGAADLPPCSDKVPASPTCTGAFFDFLGGGLGETPTHLACSDQGSSTPRCSAVGKVRDYISQRAWGWFVHCNSAKSFLNLPSAACAPQVCPTPPPSTTSAANSFLAYVLGRAPNIGTTWSKNYPSYIDQTKANSSILENLLYMQSTPLLVDFVLMQLQESCISEDGETNLDEVKYRLQGLPQYGAPALLAYSQFPILAALGLFALNVLDTALPILEGNPDDWETVRSSVEHGLATVSIAARAQQVLDVWTLDTPCPSPPSPPPRSPPPLPLAPPPPCDGGSFDSCFGRCDPNSLGFKTARVAHSRTRPPAHPFRTSPGHSPTHPRTKRTKRLFCLRPQAHPPTILSRPAVRRGMSCQLPDPCRDISSFLERPDISFRRCASTH